MLSSVVVGGCTSDARRRVKGGPEANSWGGERVLPGVQAASDRLQLNRGCHLTRQLQTKQTGETGFGHHVGERRTWQPGQVRRFCWVVCARVGRLLLMVFIRTIERSVDIRLDSWWRVSGCTLVAAVAQTSLVRE